MSAPTPKSAPAPKQAGPVRWYVITACTAIIGILIGIQLERAQRPNLPPKAAPEVDWSAVPEVKIFRNAKPEDPTLITPGAYKIVAIYVDGKGEFRQHNQAGQLVTIDTGGRTVIHMVPAQ